LKPGLPHTCISISLLSMSFSGNESLCSFSTNGNSRDIKPFFFLNFVFAYVEQLITNLHLQKSKDLRELNNNEIVVS
jgi:hypothetical protein